MVRFVNGSPDVVYYSEHASGSAYKYSAVDKIGVRPVSYIATGTHANYPVRLRPFHGRNLSSLLIAGVQKAGNQNYEHIPFDILKDQTDKGPVWDVTKNFRGFWYNPSSGAISIASGAGPGGANQPSEGASWLNFSGFWGDKKWPTSRFGQYCVADECLMEDGPTGKQATRFPPNHNRSPHSPNR
jgi:hypothetical protein